MADCRSISAPLILPEVYPSWPCSIVLKSCCTEISTFSIFPPNSLDACTMHWMKDDEHTCACEI
uniref:Uncharacterized protein n=1 Tax=Arundo donax TaxID=35708 RepID=A0A0A9B2V6_ARUDO